MTSFNEDYFEHGISKGISGYENYHFIPERSYKEAHWFIKYMEIRKYDKIIDYGCAKGFFVKAMNDLGYETYGFDISAYALSCSVIPEKTSNLLPSNISAGFCKDVLEHCKDIITTLSNLRFICNHWLFVVPLAIDNKYIIPEYEKDITHINRFSNNKWLDLIENYFAISQFHYSLFGIKDNWKQHKQGNLFIITE